MAWLEGSSHVTVSLLQAAAQVLTRLLMHLRKPIGEGGRVAMDVDDGFYPKGREAKHVCAVSMSTYITTGRRGLSPSTSLFSSGFLLSSDLSSLSFSSPPISLLALPISY